MAHSYYLKTDVSFEDTYSHAYTKPLFGIVFCLTTTLTSKYNPSSSDI